MLSCFCSLANSAPSKNFSDSFLRNDSDAVANFLDTEHNAHYRIYNLTEQDHSDTLKKKFKTWSVLPLLQPLGTITFRLLFFAPRPPFSFFLPR